MYRITRHLVLPAILATGILFNMCGPKPPAKGYSESVPNTIQKLIEKKYKESVYSVGTANGPSEKIAIQKATMDARSEIAREFEAQIDALQKSYEESINDKSVDEYSQVQEVFASLEISGSKIAKSMVRPEKKGIYSAKVLVVVSAEQLKNIIDEKMRTYTSFKASKAYKELEERVAKEKNMQETE